ncbi:MAG: 30S ribosomal protein S18 [Mycoplasmoidaceae bacterium]
MTEKRERTYSGNPKYRQNKFYKRKKFCKFCAQGIEHVDYKDVDTLVNYINFNKKIIPAKQSFNCTSHQRRVSTAIKRARIVALLPYIAE